MRLCRSLPRASSLRTASARRPVSAAAFRTRYPGPRQVRIRTSSALSASRPPPLIAVPADGEDVMRSERSARGESRALTGASLRIENRRATSLRDGDPQHHHECVCTIPPAHHIPRTLMDRFLIVPLTTPFHVPLGITKSCNALVVVAERDATYSSARTQRRVGTLDPVPYSSCSARPPKLRAVCAWPPFGQKPPARSSSRHQR